jgi:hypothetical protein
MLNLSPEDRKEIRHLSEAYWTHSERAVAIMRQRNGQPRRPAKRSPESRRSTAEMGNPLHFRRRTDP